MNTDFDEAVNLLKHLQDRGVYGFIAGGFLRDQYMGAPWRDIDLYVSMKDFGNACKLVHEPAAPISLDPISMLANVMQSSAKHNTFARGDPEYDHQYIWSRTSWRADKVIRDIFNRDFDIDVIGINPDQFKKGPDYIVSRFNLTLAQMWMDWNGQVHESYMCAQDRENNVCTILRETWGFTKTADGINKLQAKYPALKIQMQDGSGYNEEKFRAGLYQEDEPEFGF